MRQLLQDLIRLYLELRFFSKINIGSKTKFTSEDITLAKVIDLVSPSDCIIEATIREKLSLDIQRN